MAAKAAGATVPHLNVEDIRGLDVGCMPIDRRLQSAVAETLAAIDGLMENNQRRIKLLEQMAEATYREWFVHFRYPGHRITPRVDSTLGSIPEDWCIRRVAEIATSERSSVTAGPFGSRLGRKDYTSSGVPVIRGANLRVGGGFDENNLVFVSEEKANELRSSLAGRGDIIITQRGTLGQVGLIPSHSRFSRYLLSQSQMKLTTDPLIANTRFVYMQLCSEETTARFVAQAMSSGVPHVNLRLLREFELVVPPLHLQDRFARLVDPLADQQWMLREQERRLCAMRDLLLPKLVTGEIDVSTLDLDGLVGAVG